MVELAELAKKNSKEYTPPEMPSEKTPLTLEDVNPFFLADSLVSDSIIDCEIEYCAACRSSFFHASLIVLPLIPIIIFIISHGCTSDGIDPWDELSSHESGNECDGLTLDISNTFESISNFLQSFLLMISFSYTILWCCYFLSYILLFKSGQRRILNLCITMLIYIFFFSALYAINVLMWLSLSVLITPAKSLAVILLILSAPAYVYFAITELEKLSLSFEKSLESMKAATEKAKQDAIKAAGINQDEIIYMVVVGGLGIVFFVMWLIIGFLSLAVKKNSGGIDQDIGQLVTACGTAYSGYRQLNSKLATTKEKMEEERQKLEKQLVENAKTFAGKLTEVHGTVVTE